MDTIPVLQDITTHNKHNLKHGTCYRVTIPDGTTEIKDLAFYNCMQIYELRIPEGVRCISHGAFEGCKNLNGVVHMPDSLTTVCEFAFSGAGVTDITFGADSVLDKVGLHAFGRSELARCDLPHNTRLIEFGAFSSTKMETFRVPANLRVIPKLLFERTPLRSIIWGDACSVHTIDGRAFKSTKLSGVLTLPTTLALLGEQAFYHCNHITELVIPDLDNGDAMAPVDEAEVPRVPTTVIEACAFGDCANLVRVTLPEHMTAVPKRMFAECVSLKHIVIPPRVKSIGDHAFEHCESLSELNIPGNVATIGQSAFEYCLNLAILIVNEGVVEIRACAFSGCFSLTVIQLPSTLSVIEPDAFRMVEHLQMVNGPTSIMYYFRVANSNTLVPRRAMVTNRTQFASNRVEDDPTRPSRDTYFWTIPATPTTPASESCFLNFLYYSKYSHVQCNRPQHQLVDTVLRCAQRLRQPHAVTAGRPRLPPLPSLMVDIILGYMLDLRAGAIEGTCEHCGRLESECTCPMCDDCGCLQSDCTCPNE
jgi:hypothetical protein